MKDQKKKRRAPTTGIPEEQLRHLRNEIPVDAVIRDMRLATDRRGRRRTFQCPACGEFHTAINPRANLARCFRCARNFNPIDLVIEARGSTFLDAVRYLTEHVDTIERGGWVRPGEKQPSRLPPLARSVPTGPDNCTRNESLSPALTDAKQPRGNSHGSRENPPPALPGSSKRIRLGDRDFLEGGAPG